jgi:hypothetical protein
MPLGSCVTFVISFVSLVPFVSFVTTFVSFVTTFVSFVIACAY